MSHCVTVPDFQSKIDFIVAVGGDGSLLYVNTLFPGRVPPLIPFRVGSLAFVSKIVKYINFLTYIIKDGCF